MFRDYHFFHRNLDEQNLETTRRCFLLSTHLFGVGSVHLFLFFLHGLSSLMMKENFSRRALKIARVVH